MIYCCYILIVPICYIHIYKFRKNYKTPGNNQQQLIEMRLKHSTREGVLSVARATLELADYGHSLRIDSLSL